MEPELAPITVYTIREYREDSSLAREHIFLGKIIDEGTLKKLNTGRKDPNDKEIKPLFNQFKIEFTRTKAIQTYYPILIELNDTWAEVYQKIKNSLKIDSFYFWHDDLPVSLLHHFLYKNNIVKINPNPFKSSESKDLVRLFEAYGNLILVNKSNQLIRSELRPDQKIFSLITGKAMNLLAKTFVKKDTGTAQNLNVFIHRYLPPNLNIQEIPSEYLDQIGCLTELLRNDSLPLIKQKVNLKTSDLEKCIISINKSDDEPFINLETIFQLIPLDEILIFTKMKKRDRSISKVSKKVQKFKSQVSKDLLAEWADIEEHHRGLLYRKLKDTAGLVIYRIQDNGSIELEINWTKPVAGSNQLKEIIIEIDYINQFITRLNSINYQLPEKDNFLIELADINFMGNPISATKFVSFDFKTLIDTSKQQISWNAFNHLLQTFRSFLSPIFSWRIYNKKELRREIGGIPETFVHYLKTDNVLLPEKIHSILFSLGLVGLISKEQTVTVEQQKDILIEQQDKFGAVDLDRLGLDEKIKELKENNPGVLIHINFDGSYYVLDVKGAHKLEEINEINYLLFKSFEYYLHIATVYKFIKNYNCQNLSWILNSDEKIDEKIKETKKKITKISPEKIPEAFDVFDVEDLEEEEAMEIIPEQPRGLEEAVIPKELAEIPEEEEVITTGSKKVKNILEYLKDVSPIFKTEYRRHGCTTNLPVVMSISDFWHNYRRLIKRFETYKAKLRESEIDEYQSKFKKDLESQDPNLDKFKKRVEFVYKKTSSSSDKKILNEIIDIADRYHKGALMQVPLNKKKTEYSKEYFYLCPLRWCHFCRESRLLDEIESGAKGTACQICASKIYKLVNPKNSYIGFPSSKKYPHINCLPCCFKNPSKFNKKIAECNITHPTKKIQRPTEKSQPNTSHILTGDVIPFNRFGYLDGEVSGKLNNFFNDGAIIDKIKNNQEVFLLKGVNDVGEKDSFLEAISYFKHPDVERKRPDELRDFLVNAVEQEGLFYRLNNGLISSIFKTPDNTWNQALDDFKFHLMYEYLNEDLLWHLISIPDVMVKGGFNLLIIQRTQSIDEKEHKYTMLCPIGIRMEDYFDPKKTTGVLLKLENNIYYPISRVTCSIDYNNIISCTREAYEFLLFNIEDEFHVRDLFNHAISSCSYPSNEYERDRLGLEETIEELKKTIYLSDVLMLRLNPYYQIVEIMLEVKVKNKKKILTIPIKPTPIPLESSNLYQEFKNIDLKFKKEDHENFTTFSETFDLIKTLIKKTKLPLKVKYFVKNSKELVYGIKLENGLVIKFDPVKENLFRAKEFGVILQEDSEQVDLAILAHTKEEQDDRLDYVNRTTFQKESYQRLRFELSRVLSKDNDTKEEIIEILGSDQSSDRKRSAIEKIIKQIINKISVIETPNLKKYQLPQIRQLCSNQKECAKDPHCFVEKGSCKVLLPKTLILPNDIKKKNTIARYVVLITDEILRNVIKRTELLTGKVSIYVNPSQMVYHSGQEILINDPNYPTQIDDLYARTTDYLDLLRRHYYVESSEVFTREVEQNLHYFAEESWYKNTGLSRNDFVMNSRSIYDLLAEIFGEDLGERLWTFISKSGWKIWLNAFRTILPDEYSNIYQHSQFMEHVKYGRSTITDLHLSIISSLYNAKLIIMNRSAIGSRKFHCLGTTQAHSTSKSYLIFYKYDDLDTYLVGKTPHIDLTNDSDVVYYFKEDKIPQKFHKLWSDQCKLDHKVQKSPDLPDFLIKDIPLSEEYDTFVDDLKEVPDITKEKIIPPPRKKPSPPKFLLEEEEKPKKITFKKKPPAKLKLKKKLALPKKESPKKLKLKFKPPAKKKLTFKAKPKPKLTFKKRPSRARSVSRGRPRARTVSRGRRRARTVSRGRPRARTVSRGRRRARSVSVGRRRGRSISRGRSRSRGKAKKKLTFKRRR